MAQIDTLIEKMQQHDARRVVLIPDQPIELHGSKGRVGGAALNRATIQGILQEVTPSHLKLQAAMGNVDFRYTPSSGDPVTVTAFQDGDNLQVVVAATPKQLQRPVAPPPLQPLGDFTYDLTLDFEETEEPQRKALARGELPRMPRVTNETFIKEVWDAPGLVAVVLYDDAPGSRVPWGIFNRMADYFEGGLKFMRCNFDKDDAGPAYRYVNLGRGKYASLALVIFQGEEAIYQPSLDDVDAIDLMMEIEKVLVSLGVRFPNYSGDRHKSPQAQAGTRATNVAPPRLDPPPRVQPPPSQVQARPAPPLVPAPSHSRSAAAPSQEVRCPHCGSSNPSNYRRCESCHNTYDPKSLSVPTSTHGVSHAPSPSTSQSGEGERVGAFFGGLLCWGIAWGLAAIGEPLSIKLAILPGVLGLMAIYYAFTGQEW